MAAKLSAFLKHHLPDRWMDAIIFRMHGCPDKPFLRGMTLCDHM
jgi:hypothetical protein